MRRPEAAATSAATASSAAALRAAKARSAPSRARAAAIAAPMPRLAPVTIATLPARLTPPPSELHRDEAIAIDRLRLGQRLQDAELDQRVADDVDRRRAEGAVVGHHLHLLVVAPRH